MADEIERTIVVPLRKTKQAPRTRRANRAVKELRENPPFPDMTPFVTTREQIKSLTAAIDRQNIEITNKNLVASMLEGCGFEVVNIGIDVSADKFIEAVKQNQPDILCMSALLTTTMGYMKEVIEALERAGIRDQVKVMVGGAPVTQGFADEIGADGYSDNANSAVTVAKQLLGML